MDVQEKKVFRRKMPIVAEILDFSPGMQKIYASNGLIKDDMVATVMKEKTKTAQMFRFLELLAKDKIKKPLNKLMNLLEERGFRWLCYEIKADVKAEKEQLQIEEYVYREAGIMVHAQFGKCKRISEVDKKDIQLMMSWRYQVAKEAWQEQMEACEKDKQALEEYKTDAETKMKVYYDALLAFLEKQEGHLDPSADQLLKNMREDSENNLNECGNPKRDQAEMTNEAFDEFLSAMGKVAERKDSLEDERKKCESLLEMKDPSVPLDIAIQSRLSAGKDDVEKAMAESEAIKDHSQVVFKELYEFKSKIGKEGQDKDKRLMQLESAVKRLSDQNKDLMVENAEAQGKKKDAEANWKTWKERCQMLEKTRKLGYYDPGWYDQLYGICDIHYVRDTEKKKRPPTDKILSPTCRCSKTPDADRPKSSRGYSSVTSSRSDTPGGGNSSRPKSGKFNGLRRGKPGKKVARGKSSEQCTIHSLDSIGGVWKKGNFVLKKNDFSSSIDVVRDANDNVLNDDDDLFEYPKYNKRRPGRSLDKPPFRV